MKPGVRRLPSLYTSRLHAESRWKTSGRASPGGWIIGVGHGAYFSKYSFLVAASKTASLNRSISATTLLCRST